LCRRIAELEKVEAQRMRVKEVLDRSNGELTIRSQMARIFLTVPEDEMYGEILQVVLEAAESKYGVFGYIDEYGAFVCPSTKGCHWVFQYKRDFVGS
jgi:hypothetical protein